MIHGRIVCPSRLRCQIDRAHASATLDDPKKLFVASRNSCPSTKIWAVIVPLNVLLAFRYTNSDGRVVCIDAVHGTLVRVAVVPSCADPYVTSASGTVPSTRNSIVCDTGTGVGVTSAPGSGGRMCLYTPPTRSA